MNKQICRLCLQTISGNYQTVEESLKDALKLNMDISEEAVKCSDCSSNLEMFFKFKSACDYMREVKFPADIKHDINLDPDRITDNLTSPTESKNEIKCCFCTKTNVGEFLTSLNESKQHTYLLDTLKECIPKLNLITQELLTCDTCLDALQGVLTFVMKCWDVEQKINEYAEIKGSDGKGQIGLKDVKQFIFKPIVKFETESGCVNELRDQYDQIQDKYTMQSEADIKYEKGIDNPELFIKTEAVDIKSEDSDSNSFEEPSAVTEFDDGSLVISVLKSQKRNKKCINQDQLTCKNSEGVTMCMCETCSYTVKHENCFRQPKLLHKSSSDRTMFKCKLCPYEAKCGDNLNRHNLIHKGPLKTTGFKCELCPYETKRQYHFNQHILIHKSPSEVTMFKCELCPFETKHKNYVKRHKLIHKSTTETTMFKCKLCQHETKHQRLLKRHQLIHKNTSEVTMYKCELCPYETKRKGYIKQHELNHKSFSDVTIFKCYLCPYEAKRKEYIKQHILKHRNSLDLTMFKCELCPYETTRKKYLKTHKLIHRCTSN